MKFIDLFNQIDDLVKEYQDNNDNVSFKKGTLCSPIGGLVKFEFVVTKGKVKK